MNKKYTEIAECGMNIAYPCWRIKEFLKMDKKKSNFQGGADKKSTGKLGFGWGDCFHSKELTDLFSFFERE